MKTSQLEARELLELAAKAAGIDAEWHNPDDADYDAEHDGLWLKGERTPDNDRYWNPLTDDGDALRLASKLLMTVEFGNNCVLHPVEAAGEGTDPLAATRRAIVRAAAAIGEQMP